MRLAQIAFLPCFVLCCAAASPGVAQDGGPQNGPPAEFDIDIGGWGGGAFPVPGTNEFSHCAIERAYGEDVTLAFLMNAEGRMALGIGRQGWTLDADNALPAQVAVDGGSPFLMTATAASDKLLVFPLGGDPAVRQALQRGNAVTVTSELITREFALTGTFKAIDALTACVSKALEIAQAPPPSGQRMTADVVARLMDSAGITGLALASPDEIADAQLPVEQVWTVGPLRGALHQAPRGDTVAMGDFIASFTAEFEALCPGPFSADFGETEEFAGQYALATGALSCEGEEATTYTEMVIVLDDSFYSAFVHEGLVEDEEAVRQVNGRLAEVFRVMIGTQRTNGGGG